MGLNLADCVELPARQYPDRPAVVLDPCRLSFAQLRDQVRRVSGYLKGQGLGPGGRVALLLPNTPHFPIAYYGILHAGGVAVPLNPYQTPRELAYLFADCDACHIIVWEEMADAARAARDEAAPGARLAVVRQEPATDAAGADDDFMSAIARSMPEPRIAETGPDDLAVIAYTGAYAGRPMGAELTHFNLFQNAQTVATRMLYYTPEDRCLVALPLFHSFGQCVMMNTALLSGACMVLMPRFDAAKVLEAITAERITIVGFVPTMYQFLLAAKCDPAPDLSSLRLALAGGSTIDVATLDAFRERFGKTILEGYGLTETSPVVSFNMTEASNRPGSVGVPIWGCEIRIVDADGHPLPAGVTGEVLVRGHNVMRGYRNHPEATERTIRGGWLHTGDWGALDDDGYLYLKGLKKDMLIRAGLNVYPREIELVLEEHPAVREAAVVGVPDRVRGEEPKAFVVLNAPADGMDKELKAWCRARLAGYKCPRAFDFCAVLPRLDDGRFDKAALRDSAAT